MSINKYNVHVRRSNVQYGTVSEMLCKVQIVENSISESSRFNSEFWADISRVAEESNDVVMPGLNARDHELDLPCAQRKTLCKGMINIEVLAPLAVGLQVPQQNCPCRVRDLRGAGGRVPSDGDRRTYMPYRPLVRTDDRRCPHVSPRLLLHRYLQGLDSWRCRGTQGKEEEEEYSGNAKDHHSYESKAVNASRRRGGDCGGWVGGVGELGCKEKGWAPCLNT